MTELENGDSRGRKAVLHLFIHSLTHLFTHSALSACNVLGAGDSKLKEADVPLCWPPLNAAFQDR